MMTIEELYDIIKKQQEEIDDLKDHLTRLKEWSDLNDYYLREMIDALTESVDNNMIKIAINQGKIQKCQCCCHNHNKDE